MTLSKEEVEKIKERREKNQEKVLFFLKKHANQQYFNNIEIANATGISKNEALEYLEDIRITSIMKPIYFPKEDKEMMVERIIEKELFYYGAHLYEARTPK